MTSNRFLYLALFCIWMKTYLVQRFCFELQIADWDQEMIMLLNPAAPVIWMTLLLMLLVRRRLASGLVALSFASSLLLFADLVFFRFFNDFLTIPVLLQSDNISDLKDSALSLVQPSDALLFADGAALAAIRWATSPVVRPWDKYRAVAAASLAILLLTMNYSMAESVRPELLTRAFDRQLLVKNIGAYHYHVYDAVVNARMGSRKALAGPADYEAVSRYFDRLPTDEIDPRTFGIAKGRNVFLVSLESLQSFALERTVNGHELTPFLNRLLRDSFYFENFYHQTGQGKTSDAEFLLDTSLYPLPTGAVFFTHAHNTYRAMPEQLKRHGYYPAAFHANDPSFWNRGAMYSTLGYETFYSSRDYEQRDEERIGWGLSDVSFFEQSVDRIRELPQPFFAKLITLTNHYPFTLDAARQAIPEYTSKSKTLNRYLPTVRYLDSAVERLFEEVKAAGLYENSIFVLYGDHYGISRKHNKAMAQLLDKSRITPLDEVELQRVPLIIHIPGVPGERMRDVAGQIDVKPTLLHLLGIEERDRFAFGRDLFAGGRPRLVVFRDGGFVTNRLVYAKNACYDKTSRAKTSMFRCEALKQEAAEQLVHSDMVIYGDLLRFQRETPRKL